MRLREAQAVCPEAQFVPFVEDRYQEPWRKVLDLLATHVSTIEPVTLGEAFFDLPDASPPTPRLCRRGFSPDAIAVAVPFTCLLAAGPSKFVARVAAEVAPGRVIAEEEAAAFLAPLPIGELRKMGRRHFLIEQDGVRIRRADKKIPPSHFSHFPDHLAALGLTTLGLLQRLSPTRLAEHFGPDARRLIDLAHGIDHSPVEPLYPPRSLAFRLPLPGGVSNLQTLDEALRKLSGRIAEQLAAGQEACTQVTLHLETEWRPALSQTLRLRSPAATGEEILRACRVLRNRMTLTAPVTAMALRVSDFRRATSRQLTLFGRGDRRLTSDSGECSDSAALSIALASVHEHFGSQAALIAAEIEVPRRERLLAVL